MTNNGIARKPDGFVEPGFYFWLGSDAELAEAQEDPDYVASDLGDVDESEFTFRNGDDDGQ